MYKKILKFLLCDTIKPMKYRYLLISIFIIFSFFYSPKDSFGQIFNQVPEANLSVSLTPEIPGPNEDVSAEIISFETNLDKANVIWRINGNIVSSGTGKRKIFFKTGNLGATTNLSLTVTTIEGVTINRQITIRPTSVDIIWEAETYTPPFFKGKSLFSHESLITFTAIPSITGQNGSTPSPQNLIYTWKRNGSALPDFSGYGKNTYKYKSGIISRPVQIEVVVTSPNSDSLGRGFATVYPIDPLVVFYEKNPLYGIMFNKSISGNIKLEDKREIEIVALPLFFSGKTISNNKIVYDWKINNGTIDSKTLERSKIFRPIENTSGSSIISVSAQNTDGLLQTADKGFNLEFTTNESNQEI